MTKTLFVITLIVSGVVLATSGLANLIRLEAPLRACANVYDGLCAWFGDDWLSQMAKLVADFMDSFRVLLPEGGAFAIGYCLACMIFGVALVISGAFLSRR